MEHIWTILMLKILHAHLLRNFVANSKIDAIYALYPESFCDKNLAVRKVFAFSDSAELWAWLALPVPFLHWYECHWTYYLNSELQWPYLWAQLAGLIFGFATASQAKGWKRALLEHFLVGFHHFFRHFFAPTSTLCMKIPILQKNQSNSFIFVAGALCQKFRVI